MVTSAKAGELSRNRGTWTGAALYRGPIKIEARLSMCQARDPWGNCIGLRGPAMARPRV